MFSLSLVVVSFLLLGVWGRNSTYENPMLPGFHPDPSCIFVPELDNTYFCASSSFLVFPGLQIHASKDLKQWKLISNALSRPEQLPGLNTAKRATSGIWAATLRYRKGTFYLVTTLVYDDFPIADPDRFDSMIFTSRNPFSSASWSNPQHFNFPGYDTSPFWDDDNDGQLYITATHAWQVDPGIKMVTLNLRTGTVGPTVSIWNGTGGSSPEGPHIYSKDGFYYLLIAEGGTGSGHMATLARAKNISGPYDPCPHNPVLTAVNTTRYFQDVGHADVFQDVHDNWWAVALSVRQAPDGSYPMGRETSLTPVTWEEGGWPVFDPVNGSMEGWHMDSQGLVEGGEGSLITASENIQFEPGWNAPPEFVHWRFPVDGSYVASAQGHKNTLQLTSSLSNLTGHDGRSAEPLGQTFVGRRQVHSFFTYRSTIDISTILHMEQEVGVTVFLDQLHHYDLGIVIGSSTSPPETNANISIPSNTPLIPYLRLRGITTVPNFISADIAILPLPKTWPSSSEIVFEITAANITHYMFSAWPVDHENEIVTVGYAPGLGLTWGFTGALLGAYATTNGGTEPFKTYVGDWQYLGLAQVIG